MEIFQSHKSFLDLFLMSYYNRARRRAKRVKNPWNLLQIPLTVGGIAVFTWFFLHAVIFIISIFRPTYSSLNSYSVEDVREFIVIPLILAAMPLGMMLSNIVVWLVSPLRRIQEEEAIGHKGTDFISSMQGLVFFAYFSVPIGLGISALIAALGH